MARLLPLVILLAFASLAEATVVISEVLADPPTGDAGDANQDGQRNTYEDEFIELYNAGSAPVDISGWRLGDSSKSSDSFFQFPANAVIEPSSYVVLFGGGNPSGFTVPVYTDDGRIGNGLTNGGEDIRLLDDTGTEVSVVSHSTWPNDQSIVRNPLDGDVFEPHKTASPTGDPFSPGRATDAEPETPEVPETPEPETPEPETPEPETPEPETPEPETPKHPNPKHQNPKHQNPKHPNPKHQNPKHQNPKHQNPKHQNLYLPTLSSSAKSSPTRPMDWLATPTKTASAILMKTSSSNSTTPVQHPSI